MNKKVKKEEEEERMRGQQNRLIQSQKIRGSDQDQIFYCIIQKISNLQKENYLVTILVKGNLFFEILNRLSIFTVTFTH